MAWIMRGVLIVLCVWLAEGAKKVKLMDKAAQIGVSVIDADTGAVVNTTYIFGVFGLNSLSGPVSGKLVHVRSEGNINDGCNDYNHDLPTHDWVALIERGTCYFTNKIRKATKQYNATAVLVYDNSQSTGTTMMQSRVDDEVYVLVSQAYGRKLALMVDSGLHLSVNITSPNFSSSPSLLFSHFSLFLLVTFLAGCFLVVL